MLQQITNWHIDTPATEQEYLFKTQLVQENKWCPKFTEQVIEEYKKFLYLCQVAEFPCVPSKSIDEVWHHHILRTLNYSKMCNSIFGKFLHHVPTNGKEAQKLLEEQFQRTLEAYEKTFGQTAPVNVWIEKANGVCCSEI